VGTTSFAAGCPQYALTVFPLFIDIVVVVGDHVAIAFVAVPQLAALQLGLSMGSDCSAPTAWLPVQWSASFQQLRYEAAVVDTEHIVSHAWTTC
jgi:hypothetical protein